MILKHMDPRPIILVPLHHSAKSSKIKFSSLEIISSMNDEVVNFDLIKAEQVDTRVDNLGEVFS